MFFCENADTRLKIEIIENKEHRVIPTHWKKKPHRNYIEIKNTQYYLNTENYTETIQH